jgi:hypothetical protein
MKSMFLPAVKINLLRAEIIRFYTVLRNMRCGYEVTGILANVPVYLQLTDKGKLRGTPVEQLYTYSNDDMTVGNIFGTPVVE